MTAAWLSCPDDESMQIAGDDQGKKTFFHHRSRYFFKGVTRSRQTLETLGSCDGTRYVLRRNLVVRLVRSLLDGVKLLRESWQQLIPWLKKNVTIIRHPAPLSLAIFPIVEIRVVWQVFYAFLCPDGNKGRIVLHTFTSDDTKMAFFLHDSDVFFSFCCSRLKIRMCFASVRQSICIFMNCWLVARG